MDHELLKFLNVVETGSFSEAAEQLHISQPALSTAIKNLERSIGSKLLLRKSSGLKLTKAGQLVYDSAKRIRLETDNRSRKLEELQQGDTSIRVGMIDSLADQIFRGNMDISSVTEVVIDNSSSLIQDIQEDKLDIAFIAYRDIDYPDLEVKKLGNEKFELVAKARTAIDPPTPQVFLTYNIESNTFKGIDAALRKKLVPEYKFFSTNPYLLRGLTLSGAGMSMLPSELVHEDIQKGRLVKLDLCSFSRPIAYVVAKGKYVNRPMKEYINRVSSLL